MLYDRSSTCGASPYKQALLPNSPGVTPSVVWQSPKEVRQLARQASNRRIRHEEERPHKRKRASKSTMKPPKSGRVPQNKRAKTSIKTKTPTSSNKTSTSNNKTSTTHNRNNNLASKEPGSRNPNILLASNKPSTTNPNILLASNKPRTTHSNTLLASNKPGSANKPPPMVDNVLGRELSLGHDEDDAWGGGGRVHQPTAQPFNRLATRPRISGIRIPNHESSGGGLFSRSPSAGAEAESFGGTNGFFDDAFGQREVDGHRWFKDDYGIGTQTPYIKPTSPQLGLNNDFTSPHFDILSSQGDIPSQQVHKSNQAATPFWNEQDTDLLHAGKRRRVSNPTPSETLENVMTHKYIV